MMMAKFRWLRKLSTARILLIIGAVMLAVEGTFSINLHQTTAFTAYLLILVLSLSLVIADGFRRKAKAGFLLNHIGFLLIICGSMSGSTQVTRCRLLLHEGEASNIAYDSNRMVTELPFCIALDSFRIEHYAQSPEAPKQFRSYLLVDGHSMVTEVNSPCSHDGYTIFQDGYDAEHKRYTILQLVKEPLLPIVFLGMAMLALGAVLMLLGRWKMRLAIPAILLTAGLFTALSVARINFSTLMPALRSWWFVPHLLLYMLAYSLMAVAVVLDLWHLYRKTHSNMPEILMRSSSALIIIGMLTGSIWARQAWGDYWAWDPKENWAAVTWLLSLVYLHLPRKQGHKALLIMLLTFLALQITWYGINYLPSASHSIHTYNVSR